MRITTQMHVEWNDFGNLIEATDKIASREVLKTAKLGRDIAHEMVVKDTGAAGESIYVSHRDFDDYDERVSAAIAAKEAHKRKDIKFFAGEDAPDDPKEAIYACAATHGEQIENGTGKHAKYGPRPFMEPSLMEAKSSFIQGLIEGLQSELKKIGNGKRKRT